jgi:superoxide dismutase, Fe-Mn family
MRICDMELTYTLPFQYDALEPYISAEVLHLHFDKHHQGYVSKYNELIKGFKDLENDSIEVVLAKLSKEINRGDKSRVKLFENGAQSWNHDFFWKSMKKDCIDTIGFRNAISKDDFVNAGMSRFASGWLWIVKTKDGAMDLCTTSNADLPMFNIMSPGTTIMHKADMSEVSPLAVCDLWEHSYYIDYRNERKKYLETFYDHLINFDFIKSNLS